jgi:hypothetical protein
VIDFVTDFGGILVFKLVVAIRELYKKELNTIQSKAQNFRY